MALTEATPHLPQETTPVDPWRRFHRLHSETIHLQQICPEHLEHEAAEREFKPWPRTCQATTSRHMPTVERNASCPHERGRTCACSLRRSEKPRKPR